MKKTKVIDVGGIKIGGDNPIVIQSMTNTDTKNIDETVNQIKDLKKAGCQIVRMAITDQEDARSILAIKDKVKIPLIADVQYDYKLALASIENGIDALRINPGNIGSRDKVEKVVSACKDKQIPIRIGVNSGSIKREFLNKYGGVNEDSMVYSALEQVEILESMGFYDIKISMKASNVDLNVKANKKLASMVNYPIHLGVTESGPIEKGSIKSSVGLGILLYDGIGDTIRVSLTGDPVREIFVAKEILRSLGLYNKGIDLISCPTCARTKIDLIGMVNEAERRLEHIDKHIQVAIMGCPVNGPGEAKEADIGIAGADGEGIIFKKGKVIKRVEEDKLIDELIKEIESL